MTAKYKTFGGNPYESAEQESEPEPESEQPEQPLTQAGLQGPVT